MVYPLAKLVGILPINVQFWISNLIRWGLYSVVRYRRAVVRGNLLRSFPQKSEKERRSIEKKFYSHLADVCVETLALASMKPRRLKERMEFLNVDQIESMTNRSCWVSAMAHFGNWEFTCGYAMYSTHDGIFGVYRPLKDAGFDKVFYKMRSRFGSTPIPMNDVGKRVVSCIKKRECYGIALISDQNPPRYGNTLWFDFLEQKTLFFTGTEKFALRFKMPVAFLHINKFKRGFYTGWFELIYDGVEQVEPGEITRRYVERLETMIRNKPELWMWSHRRWKHEYDGK